MSQAKYLADMTLAECENTHALKLSFVFDNNTQYSIVLEEKLPIREFCNDLQAVAGEIRKIYGTPTQSDLARSTTH